MKKLLIILVTFTSLSSYSAPIDNVSGEVNFPVEGKLRREIQNTCESFADTIEDNLRSIGYDLDRSAFDIKYRDMDVTTNSKNRIVFVKAICNITW